MQTDRKEGRFLSRLYCQRAPPRGPHSNGVMAKDPHGLPRFHMVCRTLYQDHRLGRMSLLPLLAARILIRWLEHDGALAQMPHAGTEAGTL